MQELLWALRWHRPVSASTRSARHARPGRQSAHNLNYWRSATTGASAPRRTARVPRRAACCGVEAEAPAGLPGQRRHARPFGGDDVIAGAPAVRIHAQPAAPAYVLACAISSRARAAQRWTRSLAEAVQRGWLDMTDGHVQPTDSRRFTNDVVSLFLMSDLRLAEGSAGHWHPVQSDGQRPAVPGTSGVAGRMRFPFSLK